MALLLVTPASGTSQAAARPAIAAVSRANTATSRANTWSLTGSMTTARSGQAAILLHNGHVLVVGGAGTSAELYDPRSGTWTPTGSMTRDTSYGHTATLLPNGRVLVTGGCCNNHGEPWASAQLYDPGTGTWSLTGSMATGRDAHTATLLRTGKVLVGGGETCAGCILASAELYDPSMGTWTTTGSMTIPRAGQTATLLRNGQVLVVGGTDTCCHITAKAELYDPRTGTWSPTGSMAIAREAHTATLLPSGRVLVAGGQDNYGIVASAELYDPDTGVWTATGSMSTVREAHTATLLPNGHILVSGGCQSQNGCTPPLASAEVYDPSTGVWTLTGSMNMARAAPTATLLPDGRVLVAGGTGITGTLASAELYNFGPGPLVQVDPAGLAFDPQEVNTASAPQIVTITNTGTLPLRVSSVTFGGANPGQYTQTTTCTDRPVLPNETCVIAVRFAPVAAGKRPASLFITDDAPTSPQSVSLTGYATGPNSWLPTGTMVNARSHHTATLLPDGRVLLAGGQDAGNNPLSSAELYDPHTNTWTATGSMALALKDHTATLLPTGDVLVAGGCDTSTCAPPEAAAELYNPRTGTWLPTGSMHGARYQHTATLLPDGRVLVAGGCCDAGGNALAGAELYDPNTGTWTGTCSLYTGRWQHTATLLANGKVLVTGGQNTQSAALASAELYDAGTGTWTLTGSMTTARVDHTATLLLRAPNGQVLVAGGQDASGHALAGVELYDVSTGTWTPTASMISPRQNHTATLLADGRVLVAGGCCDRDGDSLASAELYDPFTGLWTLGGTMHTARAQQTATLLDNRYVLVAGGTENGTWPIDLAEVYTPGRGALVWFSPPGLNAGTQRVATTSAPLTVTVGNGGTGPLIISSIVLSGTRAADFALASTCGAQPLAPNETCALVVRFTPAANGSPAVRQAGVVLTDNTPTSPQTVPISGQATGPTTWMPTGSMTTGRQWHTATLLPNRLVLVAGGDCCGTAELYNSSTGTWTPTGSMSTSRSRYTATLLLNGQVLVAGGDCCGTAELYNPNTGTWTVTGSMTTQRSQHTATLLSNGKVLVAGGYCDPCHADLASAELYDPHTGSWTSTGSMNTAREYHAATLLPSGKVLVAGGDNSTSVSLTSAELYDPNTGTWTATGSMTMGRYALAAALLHNGQVLVAGGCCDSSRNILATAELYDPHTGSWTATGSITTGRAYDTLTVLPGGMALIAGGCTGFIGSYPCTSLASAEVYDPRTGTWRAVGAMDNRRVYQTATLLPSGQVLTAGGQNDNGTVLTSAELYTP